MAIFCGKCDSKVSVTGTCKTCKKRDAKPPMQRLVDLPLAADGLTSYRYRGTFGYIMIGAIDTGDALREAARSTRGPITVDKLEVWDGSIYKPVEIAQ